MITLFAVAQQLRGLGRADGRHFACRLRSCSGRRRAAAGAEAAGDDAEELAIHRAAHDVGQDCARGAHEGSGDDQQVVGQHEAGRRRGPARVAVEHRHHDGHVGAADRHHHVHAEEQCDHGHHGERQDARLQVVGLQELHAEPDHREQPGEVEQVPPGQQHRLAADLAGQLAERDDRTRERDRTDQDADVDLGLVDRLLGAGQDHRGVHVAREADEACGEADEAVHDRDELRHLRHLHLAGCVQADAAAHRERADDPRQAGRGDPWSEDGREHGDCHADDSEQVAAPRGLGIREAAEAQDEQDGGPNVGNRGEIG